MFFACFCGFCGFSAFVAVVFLWFLWLLVSSPFGVVLAFYFEFICMCLWEEFTQLFSTCPNLPFWKFWKPYFRTLVEIILQLYLYTVFELCFKTVAWLSRFCLNLCSILLYKMHIVQYKYTPWVPYSALHGRTSRVLLLWGQAYVYIYMYVYICMCYIFVICIYVIYLLYNIYI